MFVVAACLAHGAMTQEAPPTEQPTSPSTPEVDVKTEGKLLVDSIRSMTANAKAGTLLKPLFHTILDIINKSSGLIQQLKSQVSQCDTNMAIKMAATGTGSHEILTLLLADNKLKVHNGRLSLSLAVLEQMAQQLEDVLSRSEDPTPHLAAIVFGAKTAGDIIRSADDVVNNITNALQAEDMKNLTRLSARQSSSLNLGSGFSSNSGGSSWSSSTGKSSFNLGGSYSNGNFGLSGTYQNGGHSITGGGSYNPSSGGYGVSGGYQWSSPNGNTNVNVGGNYNSNGQWGVGASLGIRF